MKQYLELLRDIVDNGVDRDDRTGVGTRSVFGRQIRFELDQGFPLLTTKTIHLKSIVYELLWFLKGETNVDYLNKNGVTIWNQWADNNGELGPIYGKQWTAYPGANKKTINQIALVVEKIRNTPFSRRLVVSAWNPAELPDEMLSPQENVQQGRMALAPCHCLFQFHVSNGKLSCQLYQRSADCFLGVPFNIASYSLLTLMIAQQCNLKVGEFVHTFGDCHIYLNHLTDKIVYEQLRRTPRTAPNLHILRKPDSLFGYRFEDFRLTRYNPHPPIKAPIAV